MSRSLSAPLAALTAALVLAAVPAAFAQDKAKPKDDTTKDDKKADPKAAKLSGVWERAGEPVTMSLDFTKAGVVVVSVKAEDKVCQITADYAVDKDGVLKAKTTKVDTVNDFPTPENVKKGYEFAFKLKVDGKKATLSDFEAENGADAKPHIEGEYTMKDAKKGDKKDDKKADPKKTDK